jgi:hypothetical protein
MSAFAPGGTVDTSRWDQLPTHIVDMIWGNNPDPGYLCSQQMVLRAQMNNPELLVLESRAPR